MRLGAFAIWNQRVLSTASKFCSRQSPGRHRLCPPRDCKEQILTSHILLYVSSIPSTLFSASLYYLTNREDVATEYKALMISWPSVGMTMQRLGVETCPSHFHRVWVPPVLSLLVHWPILVDRATRRHCEYSRKLPHQFQRSSMKNTVP